MNNWILRRTANKLVRNIYNKIPGEKVIVASFKENDEIIEQIFRISEDGSIELNTGTLSLPEMVLKGLLTVGALNIEQTTDQTTTITQNGETYSDFVVNVYAIALRNKKWRGFSANEVRSTNLINHATGEWFEPNQAANYCDLPFGLLGVHG